MKDTFDAEIEALLVDDYVKYQQLTGAEVDNHFLAWRFAKGLFAFLPAPGLSCCASMIEYIENEDWHIPDTLFMYEKILEGSTVSLPDMDKVAHNSIPDFRYTHEQLEEFARRQRVAREL